MFEWQYSDVETYITGQDGIKGQHWQWVEEGDTYEYIGNRALFEDYRFAVGLPVEVQARVLSPEIEFWSEYRLLLVHVAGRMNRNNCVMRLRLCASAQTIARDRLRAYAQRAGKPRILRCRRVAGVQRRSARRGGRAVKEQALAQALLFDDPQRRLNALREYLQAFIMRSLHESEAGRTVAFVGGTALRFLEDLAGYQGAPDRAAGRRADVDLHLHGEVLPRVS